MIIVVPSCLKDADGALTRSDQNNYHNGCHLNLQYYPKSSEEVKLKLESCRVTFLCHHQLEEVFYQGQSWSSTYIKTFLSTWSEYS